MLALEMAMEVQKTLIGRKLKRAVKSSRAQRQAEARLQRKLRGLFEDVEAQVLRELRSLGRVPSDAASRRKLIRLLENIKEPFQREIAEEVLDIGKRGRSRAVGLLQQKGISITMDQLGEMPKSVQNYLMNRSFEASERTMRRLVGDVYSNLVTSYEEGLGYDKAYERLSREFEKMKDYELERVARTELQDAQQEGAERTIREVGVDYVQWWTADDDRVRDEPEADHAKLHGQIVRYGDRFSNGLKRPGDRSGGSATIQQWINCRCDLVPFIMPEGKRPPPGKTYFYEHELVDA